MEFFHRSRFEARGPPFGAASIDSRAPARFASFPASAFLRYKTGHAMNTFARWLVRYPLIIVLVNGAITAGLGLAAYHIRIEGSLESVLPKHDPELEFYGQVRETFGSDDIGVIGVRAADIFAPETLAKVARVTDRVAKIKGVNRVLSITNAVDPAADVFNPPPLIAHLPPSPADIRELKKKLQSTKLYATNLVAPDFKGVAINVFFADLSDTEYEDLGIDRAIESLLATESGPEKLYYTGAAHVKQAAVQDMRRDLYRFTPLAFVLVLIVLYLSFRRARAVVLTMVTVLMALVWTLGIMVLAGKAITLGTFVLPPLLLVIGSSYSIHVLARYYEHVGAGAAHSDAVVSTVEQVWPPLMISAFTTMVGFGALTTNHIVAIWDLGIFSVVGLVFLTFTSLTFLPAALQLGRVPGARGVTSSFSPRLAQRLEAIGKAAYGARAPVLAFAAVIAVATLAGVRFIHVDSDFLSYFEPDSEVRRSNEIINRKIVGSNPFYLVIEGSGPGTLKRWEVLKQIKDLQTFLDTLPGITGSISIVDYLELLEKGLNRGGEGDLIVDAEGHLVPAVPKSFWEDPANLQPVLATVAASPGTFRGVVTPDFARGNVVVRTHLSGSSQIEATLDRIRDYIEHHFPKDLRVHPTGNLVLLTGTSSDIVAGQIKSLSLALLVIFLVMAFMFLSVQVGLLAIVPNALPILVFFGILGWAGIYLNLGTSLIATIALGIAVDSTIHYMARLSRELKGEADQAQAMRRTMRNVGVPVVYTTLALFLGFLVFTGSSFVPIQNFGWLTAVTLAVALGANLLVLPALLATTKIITLWDLVGVKLGQDPQRTIPLLAGLRPAQARIVVLMGEMKSFAPGDAIVRRGESGNEMYVILDGKTEVWVGTGDERRRVAELQRGEVFGEMGLVRHNERSADVIASGAVEVLAVDERFLQRIQRRYPRIASKVFLNLTRILSDRLQRMNDQFVAVTRV